MGYTIGVTILILFCALLAFFSGSLINEGDVESRALGGALIIVCIILGSIAIAIVGFHNETQEDYISTSQAEYIDYDKVEVQVIKKNGKVSEIIYTCGDETIHLPIKEDNSND